jgi:hypothetical protein
VAKFAIIAIYGARKRGEFKIKKIKIPSFEKGGLGRI